MHHTSIRLMIFVTTLTFGAQIASAECYLDTSIDMGTQDLHKLDTPLSLTEAQFDTQPKFHDPGAYDPERDSLTLDLFNLNWDNRELNILGASIHEVDASVRWPESIGFSPSYSGSLPSFQKSYETTNGVATYTTTYKYELSGERHRGKNVELKIKAKMRGSRLTSFIIKLPIFEIFSVENGVTLLAFTGKHQELCLKSAKR